MAEDQHGYSISRPNLHERVDDLDIYVVVASALAAVNSIYLSFCTKLGASNIMSDISIPFFFFFFFGAKSCDSVRFSIAVSATSGTVKPRWGLKLLECLPYTSQQRRTSPATALNRESNAPLTFESSVSLDACLQQ